MGDRHRQPEEESVTRRPSAADEIGPDDRFAVTGRQRMHGAPPRGGEECEKHSGRGECAPIDDLPQPLADPQRVRNARELRTTRRLSTWGNAISDSLLALIERT